MTGNIRLGFRSDLHSRHVISFSPLFANRETVLLYYCLQLLDVSTVMPMILVISDGQLTKNNN